VWYDCVLWECTSSSSSSSSSSILYMWFNGLIYYCHKDSRGGSSMFILGEDSGSPDDGNCHKLWYVLLTSALHCLMAMWLLSAVFLVVVQWGWSPLSTVASLLLLPAVTRWRWASACAVCSGSVDAERGSAAVPCQQHINAAETQGHAYVRRQGKLPESHMLTGYNLN